MQQATTGIFEIFTDLPTPRSPTPCLPLNDSGIEYHTRLRGDVRSVAEYEPEACKAQSRLRLTHELDTTLTVYLSMVCAVRCISLPV